MKKKSLKNLGLKKVTISKLGKNQIQAGRMASGECNSQTTCGKSMRCTEKPCRPEIQAYC